MRPGCGRPGRPVAFFSLKNGCPCPISRDSQVREEYNHPDYLTVHIQNRIDI